MFLKTVYMEFRKNIFRTNTISVLLIILLISFMSAINFKSGIETGKHQVRLDKVITTNNITYDKLSKKLNTITDKAQKEKIKDKISALNIERISPKVVKSPFNVINNTVFNLLYLSIIIGILFGDIFSKEYSTNIESLLFSSKTSRTHLVLSKIISSFVIIVLTNLLFFISCYGMGFLFLKDTSINIPMQQLIGSEFIQSNMSVMQYISIGFLYSNLVCFLFVAVITFISSLTKNYLLPVFSGILLGFITMMSSNLWKDYSHIVKFLPTSYLDYNLFTKIRNMYNLNWSLPLILIIFSTAFFIALTIIKILKKQVC
ncbi:MAG: ABC transporter permease [Clostridium sp.]|uniref:ABC transporter permease n=1 Tax=Clostridium sp. TaxID=1506 RepID=UPI003D6C99F0